jgi:hypothetical protein
LAFMIIKIIFNSKRIALCAASGGTASVWTYLEYIII